MARRVSEDSIEGASGRLDHYHARMLFGEPVSSAPFASIHKSIDRPTEEIAAIVASWRSPALLESGSDFGEAGRWSILAARPRAVFSAVGDRWVYRSRGSKRAGRGVLVALARLLRHHRLADPSESPDRSSPPFLGGLIGSIGYDIAPLLERLPRKAGRSSTWPDIRLLLYDTAVLIDHQMGEARLWAHDLGQEGTKAVETRLDRWRRDLERPIPIPIRSELGSIESNFEPRSYRETVRKALDYIEAGDVFQVNLSQRFSAIGKVDPLDLYQRLKARSPAPFSAFLRRGRDAIVSASPEWFYQTRGDRIITRPIKGTRPRGGDETEDRALAEELRQSLKDRAELTMIVDLERNDLGRVCRFGSVQVVGGLEIESFAQVHHLVATVEGHLRQEIGPVDVLKALFPGGSITGAPKIRAMEIIDELEPCRRGIYTGAIGYFSRAGSSAFNIAIRTLAITGNRVNYQVGGGIVADSDPEAEFQETLQKGRGIRDVLEGWEPPK